MRVQLDWSRNNTMRLEVRGLADITAMDTTQYVNDAVVQATVKDEDGNTISGETWPKTLAYESGSNGDYSAAISSALDVEVGDDITATITATTSNGVASWDIPFQVVARTHRSGYG